METDNISANNSSRKTATIVSNNNVKGVKIVNNQNAMLMNKF